MTPALIPFIAHPTDIKQTQNETTTLSHITPWAIGLQ